MKGSYPHVAEAELPMTSEMALAALPGGTEAVITVDAHAIITSWNRAAERLFGYTAREIVGRPLALLVPEERLRASELTRIKALVEADGGVHDFATTRLTKDGHAVAVSITCGELVGFDGRANGYSCAMRPLGPATRVADRLYESEKLAALRAISAGFAYELGNPLAGVGAVLQLVARRTREPDTRERLQHANASLSRIANVIRELTDFTRQDGEVGMVDLNEVLRAALTLARYAHLHAPITVVFEPDAEVAPLIGSRNHLLQVFLHLVMNAYEALGDRQGTLRVASHANPDENVVVVEDTGSGIPAAAVAHVFEPFFTTKDSTGLGLFVCRRIVADELGGTIRVQSEPGVGTRFTVQLPVRSVSTAARLRGRDRRAPAHPA